MGGCKPPKLSRQMNTKMILALFAVALCSVVALPSSEKDAIVPEGHSEVALVQHGNGPLVCGGAHNAAAHWSKVPKTSDGRVDEATFVAYFKGTAFGAAAEKAQGDHYDIYLQGLFASGLQMMPGTTKTTLGSHCFSALAPLAFAFYRDGNGGYC